MKFTDLINEDFTPNEEQLKELKRAKIVYTTFKKGAVKFMHHSKRNDNDEKTVVKYTLGEPQYPWYPKNGNPNDMYLSVVVKNMTVYIKDPVLYDAIVVNPDRMQDYYGPLIYNYIIPKARRKFEKHRVKLHVGEPRVEFVFVEPEEPEAINEEKEYSPEELKKIKSIKAVFFAHKKGTISVRFNSPKTRETRDIVIGYKLGAPEINWNTFENKTKESWVTSEDITVYIKDPELYNTIIDSSALARGIIRGYIYPKMIRLFSKYNINYMPQIEPKAEFVFVETQEPKDINEGELMDKDNKNIKTLYSTLKRGKVKVSEVEGEDSIFAYKLSDEYEAYSKNGELYVSPAGMKIKEMNRAASNSNFTKVFKSLEKRFSNYRINFVKPPMTWDDLISYSFEDASSGEPINEGETELSDKDIKRCKILWEQYKKGTLIINGKKYRYQLRDEYEIFRVPGNSKPIIEIQGTFDKAVRLYEVRDDGHDVLLDYELENRKYMDAKSKIKNKFLNYGVHLSA